MRTRLLMAALLAAVVATPVADAAVAPRLALVDRSPLVVRGSGFRPSERVVVTALTASGPRRVTVRATPAGRFSATLRLANQPCGRAFFVRAVGGAGSVATVRIPGAPCVPPPID